MLQDELLTIGTVIIASVLTLPLIISFITALASFGEGESAAITLASIAIALWCIIGLIGLMLVGVSVG